MFHVISAESVEPCLVSQQCVLIATKTTDIVDDKDIPTLNMTQRVSRKAFMVEEHHCLKNNQDTVNDSSYIEES